LIHKTVTFKGFHTFLNLSPQDFLSVGFLAVLLTNMASQSGVGNVDPMNLLPIPSSLDNFLNAARVIRARETQAGDQAPSGHQQVIKAEKESDIK